MARPPEPHDPTLDAARIQWVQRHQRALWRYLGLLGARADEVEDVMQDAFVALFRRYPDEPADGQVRLLRTIARRRLFELRRRAAPADVAWSDEVDAFLAEREQALSDQRAEALDACLDELGPRARRALVLRHAEDRSVDQVAASLGLQRTGALSLLQRARDGLRSCLERRGAGAASASTTRRDCEPSPLRART